MRRAETQALGPQTTSINGQKQEAEAKDGKDEQICRRKLAHGNFTDCANGKWHLRTIWALYVVEDRTEGAGRQCGEESSLGGAEGVWVSACCHPAQTHSRAGAPARGSITKGRPGSHLLLKHTLWFTYRVKLAASLHLARQTSKIYRERKVVVVHLAVCYLYQYLCLSLYLSIDLPIHLPTRRGHHKGGERK